MSRFRKFVGPLVAAAILVSAGCTDTQQEPTEPTPTPTIETPEAHPINPVHRYTPTIFGDIAVWMDESNQDHDRNIYGHDLTTNLEFPVCVTDGDQTQPAIDGDIIIWVDERSGNPDIYGYDMATDTEFAVCTDPAPQHNPAISGDIVVWADDRDRATLKRDIYGYDMATQEEFVVCDQRDEQRDPDVSGDIIIWQETRNGNNDIFSFNLSADINEAEVAVSANMSD